MSRPLIADLANDIKSGKVNAQDLVRQSLDKLAKHAEYETVLATLDKTAEKRAEVIDQKIKNKEEVGRLAGIPFIAKDNFLVFGSETTAASNILKGFTAPYQATAINRLEAEGAICIAKANLDAFAHGSSTENSDFMITKNPHDKTRVPGGSSGGPSAVVALDIVPFALGTDTGGSIRQPASFCGIVGYKPTYGLVSRSGVVAMASSTDTIGPLTQNVEDAALVLDVIAGKDELDSTMIERDPESYTKLDRPDAPRVGIIKEYMGEGLQTDVRKIINESVEKLQKHNINVSEVSLPSLPYALAVYYIICPAEVSSNLGRYDGQRYGYSYPDATNLSESFTQTRSIGFGNEAKRRVMIGTHVLSSGYYDAYYKKAQTVRTKMIHEFETVFQDFDFLIGPTVPSTAFKIGQHTAHPLEMYLSDIMTVGVNLVGIPAISIPAGLSGGLPVGLQIMAPQKKDRQLLAMAKSIEEILL